MAKGDQQIQNQNQSQTGSKSDVFSSNQTQNQSGQTAQTVAPWEAAQPLLKNLLGQYSGVNANVTPEQQAALANVQAGAAALPSFGADASGAVNRLFGSSTAPQVGLLSKALSDYQKNLGATASGAELDPYSTPGFGASLDKLSGDITNRVKGVYSAAGRDPSGAGSFAGSLGRGLSEGLAPVIQNQYNQNKANQMRAASDLFSGTGSTAGQITSQEQIPLANAAQGIGLLDQVSKAYMTPGAAQLGAANTAQSLPLQNLAGLLNPALSFAGLGQQTAGTTTGGTTTTGSGSSSGTSSAQGTGTSTTTQPQSMFSNILGGLMGGAGLLSMFGPTGGGAAGGLSALMALSDERAKSDVEEIGELHDGQPVVRFRYKGEPKMHVGLLAQNVERVAPGAVHEFGGLKMVDYERATDRAAAMKRAA